MALLMQALNVTDVIAAVERVWQTCTHKAHDRLVKGEITQMILNGAGARDTARVLGINQNIVCTPLKK